jgi:hypothetical protein
MPVPLLVAIVAMGFGLLVAGAIAVSGLTLLGTRVVPAGTAEPGDSPLSIAVEARHEGGLVLRVQAFVAVTEGDTPLDGAQVSFSTDMREMVGAHVLGPFDMTPVSGQPGLYEGTTSVPMVGTYDVSVAVTSPVPGSGSATVEVGVVSNPTG